MIKPRDIARVWIRFVRFCQRIHALPCSVISNNQSLKLAALSAFNRPWFIDVSELEINGVTESGWISAGLGSGVGLEVNGQTIIEIDANDANGRRCGTKCFDERFIWTLYTCPHR